MAGQVGEGEHADEPVAVDDRKAADPVLGHGLGGLFDRVVGADDSIEQAAETMAEYRIRRLPIVDGNRLIGMLALADLAGHLPESRTDALVSTLSDAA